MRGLTVICLTVAVTVIVAVRGVTAADSPQGVVEAPRVAIANDGAIFVAWAYRNSYAHSTIFVGSTSDGVHMRGPVSLTSTACSGHGEGPSIATHGPNLYVTYTESVHFSDIVCKFSTDNGQTFPSGALVNDDHAAVRHMWQSLAVNEAGQASVTWIDERAGKPALYLGIDAGYRHFAGGRFRHSIRNHPRRSLPHPNLPSVRPQQLVRGAGMSGYKSLFKREVRITPSRPAVAAIGSHILLAWDDIDDNGCRAIRAVQSDDDGKAFRDLTIKDPTGDSPSVALTRIGKPVLTWAGADGTLRIALP